MAAVLVLGVTAVPVFIPDETGAWREVPGIASVEFDEEQPELGNLDTMNRDLRRLAERYAREVRQINAAMRAAAQAADSFATAAARARPDRPAWQTPYGPARRRH
ncbi:hypothetical protein [Streptomyces bauhiniae]|uniref:hypothetical protein n=1 Tax=Streptomyces bauhiniae TaxID=2340725 RepID=UPI0035DAC670